MKEIIYGSSSCIPSADVNNDGRVNVFDLSMIKDYIRSILE